MKRSNFSEARVKHAEERPSSIAWPARRGPLRGRASTRCLRDGGCRERSRRQQIEYAWLARSRPKRGRASARGLRMEAAERPGEYALLA